jgi:hypothetical protein
MQIRHLIFLFAVIGGLEAPAADDASGSAAGFAAYIGSQFSRWAPVAPVLRS